jgi:hypothetical protein
MGKARMLEHIASATTIVGFVLAFLAVGIAYREARNSRDLAASISISESFLRHLPVWRQVRDHLEAVSTQKVSPELGTPFDDSALDILNWLNTIGNMIDSRLLARPERVLAPEIRTLRNILKHFIHDTEMLRGFEDRDGAKYWRGVRVLDQTVSELTSE